jgi:hypothetical protein
MVDGSYADFARGIGFELIQPEVRRGPDGRFTIERSNGSKATILELPGIPMDVLNTRLGEEARGLQRQLRPVCDIERMESFAIAAIINRGVASLRPSEAYVNVGVWNGFSFLSGLHGNPGKRCIGIDNFSQLRSPREAFMARFEEHRGSGHEFFDMDYEEYFAIRHDTAIGLYFYDGDHAYEHQLRGLQIAEPFFTDDCVILVDDANWPEPRQATFDFVAQSERKYEVLVDAWVSGRSHPTWWNGLIGLRCTGRRHQGSPPRSSERPERLDPLEPNAIDFESRGTLVSLIVCNPQDGGPALARTIDRALAQTWPSVEVVLAGGSGDPAISDLVKDAGGSVVGVDGSDPVRAAFETGRGSFVALVDARDDALPETSVEHGLALPELARFNLGRVDERRTQRAEQAFAAARDVEESIPDGAPFILAGIKELTPTMIAGDRAMPLFETGAAMQALDDRGAIARLEELRGRGAGFVVFLPGTFGWLGRRPELEAHLRTTARPVRENDRVRVYEL